MIFRSRRGHLRTKKHGDFLAARAQTRLSGLVAYCSGRWTYHCVFNSWPGRYQVASAWMRDCLWTGKPSRYTTNHQGQLSLPSLRGR